MYNCREPNAGRPSRAIESNHLLDNSSWLGVDESVSIARERGFLRIGFHFVGLGDVDPNMNVRCTTKVPHERWTFESPIVPDAIVADIVIGEERKMTRIDSALRLQALRNFFLVALAEHLGERSDNALQMPFLVGGQLGHRKTGSVTLRAAEGDCLFAWRDFHLGCFALTTQQVRQEMRR